MQFDMINKILEAPLWTSERGCRLMSEDIMGQPPAAPLKMMKAVCQDLQFNFLDLFGG
jgi:hypothetical protein